MSLVPNGDLGSAWLEAHVHDNATACLADVFHGHTTDHVYRPPPLRKPKPCLTTTARRTRSCRSRKTPFLMSMTPRTQTGRWWVWKATMGLHRPTTLSSSRAKLPQPHPLHRPRRRQVAHQCPQPPTPLTTLSRLPQIAPRNQALLRHSLASFRRSLRKPRRDRPFRPHPTLARLSDDACNSRPKNPTTKRHHLVFLNGEYPKRPLIRLPNMQQRDPRPHRPDHLPLEVSRLINMIHQAEKSSQPLQGRPQDTVSTTYTNTLRSRARTRRCP